MIDSKVVSANSSHAEVIVARFLGWQTKDKSIKRPFWGIKIIALAECIIKYKLTWLQQWGVGWSVRLSLSVHQIWLWLMVRNAMQWPLGAELRLTEWAEHIKNSFICHTSHYMATKCWCGRTWPYCACKLNKNILKKTFKKQHMASSIEVFQKYQLLLKQIHLAGA